MTKSQKPPTYAARLRKAMTQHRPPLTIRDLEKLTKQHGQPFSYEHIRRVLSNMPHMSQAFNQAICDVLDLDVDEMWELAQQEKMRRNPGHHGVKIPDSRLAAIWAELLPSHHDKLVTIAQGMVEELRLERAESDMTPEQIREKIMSLTGRLTDQLDKGATKPSSRRHSG